MQLLKTAKFKLSMVGNCSLGAHKVKCKRNYLTDPTADLFYSVCLLYSCIYDKDEKDWGRGEADKIVH